MRATISGTLSEEALGLWGELAGIGAPPAGEAEICARGVRLVVAALGARGGAALLRAGPGRPLETVARCGVITCDPARLAPVEPGDPGEPDAPCECGVPGVPRCVSVPIPVAGQADGLLALSFPSAWDVQTRLLAQAAARTMGAALRSARLLAESRRQAATLARQNLEIDALRELAEILQRPVPEAGLMQGALDLLLARFALPGGWIFLFDPAAGRLELAASRGVSPAFARQARSEGAGECLCLQVFASGRPAVARNTIECPRLPGLTQDRGASGHACIPLRFERGVLGVMNIAAPPGETFDHMKLTFLETAGRQICLAVDRARAAASEALRNRESRALVSLAAALGRSLDLDHTLSALGDHARDLLGADRCLIFLGDGEGPHRLVHQTGAGGSKPLPEPILDMDPVAADVSIRSGGPWGPGPALIVPLRARERPGGQLVAVRTNGADWRPEEIELASALAGQASAAIENARLHQEARAALSRLQQAQFGLMNAERLSALGTLASCLAHEVRNPLNSISLQLVLLGRRVSRLDPRSRGDLPALLDDARREIARLDDLVEEFLSLSSIDRLRTAPADPRAVLNEVAALMTPVARDAGVLLVEAIEDPLPAIRIDREKMEQVLINLIRNGIEAMPSGGTLTLSGGLVDGDFQIGVSDTGTGIDPGLDVFDFFVTTKRGGTGLGLPIARRIVEAHGGTLTFDSRPGQGAIFRVRLGADVRVAPGGGDR